MTAVAAPRLPGHLPSTGDVGVNPDQNCIDDDDDDDNDLHYLNACALTLW